MIAVIFSPCIFIFITAFIDTLGLGAEDAKKVKGHDKPKFKAVVPEQRGIDGEITYCTPQGAETQRASKQAQR